MPLPTKSRYTITEAAKFIASATGEPVTKSQLLDWGSQGLYRLYLPLKWGTIRQVGKTEIARIVDSIVEVRLSSGQAATLGRGERVGFSTCWRDGIECDFMRQSEYSPGWSPDTVYFGAAGLVLLGAELDAFTASIAKSQETASATQAATCNTAPVEAPMGDLIRIDDVVATLAAMAAATAKPKPINPEFVSLGELLQRVQRARTPNLTATQSAAFLLGLGFEKIRGAPEWRCNSKTRGMVQVDDLQAKHATDRLKFVFHRGQFESDDGNGASTDYDFFGFDRREFADFLSHKVGEPLDLFCPMPEPKTDTAPALNSETPAPVAAVGATIAAATQHNIMKKSAMIAALEHEWPSIKTDLGEATRNGLNAAHTEKFSKWDADKARAWALSNGKIKRAAIVHSLAAAWSGPSQRHTTNL